MRLWRRFVIAAAIAVTILLGRDKIRAFFSNEQSTATIRATEEMASSTAETPSTLGIRNQPGCGGVFQFGSCWYLAASFESCATFCATRGGCIQSTTAGIIKENHCDAVARSFSQNLTTSSCLNVDSPGCALLEDASSLIASKEPRDVSCEAKPSQEFQAKCGWRVRRICACKE